jgi:hypothetical protein
MRNGFQKHRLPFSIRTRPNWIGVPSAEKIKSKRFPLPGISATSAPPPALRFKK